MRDIIDRRNDRPIGGGGSHSLDELSVNLHKIHRQMLQVEKRAESAAKIIQGEPATELAQFIDKLLGGFDVGNSTRFGNLENERAGLQRILLQQQAQHRRNVAGVQGMAVDIDRQV